MSQLRRSFLTQAETLYPPPDYVYGVHSDIDKPQPKPKEVIFWHRFGVGDEAIYDYLRNGWPDVEQCSLEEEGYRIGGLLTDEMMMDMRQAMLRTNLKTGDGINPRTKFIIMERSFIMSNGSMFPGHMTDELFATLSGSSAQSVIGALGDTFSWVSKVMVLTPDDKLFVFSSECDDFRVTELDVLTGSGSMGKTWRNITGVLGRPDLECLRKSLRFLGLLKEE